MYDLNKVFEDCIDLCSELNIPIANGIAIETNTRAHSFYGKCKLHNGFYTIEINADLLNEQNPLEALETTIFHELCHTCPNCMNHGKEWIKWATRINVVTGYNIKRTSTTEEKGLTYFQQPKVEIKYICTCQNCGERWEQKRKSKLVEHPEKFRCACGGRIEVEKVG